MICTSTDTAKRPACMQRFEIAEQASHCVKWLKVQGLEVLHVQQGRCSPLIIIRASLLCDQIEGATGVYERGPQGEQRYKVATRFGCEVRWDDQGGAA